MPIFDLFSKRQKKSRGEVPDVYVYDALPDGLKIQLVHIMQDSGEQAGGNSDFFSDVAQILRKEYGVMRLCEKNHNQYMGAHCCKTEFLQSFLQESNVERCLDYVELFFQLSERRMRRDLWLDGTNECNGRFREHGIGYQFEGGQILRIDSQLIHSEIVKPALKFLNEPYLAGAQEEYLKAHEHYRRGDFKEALVFCGNSFESTLKAICDKRRWTYDSKKATASTLIAICRDNGLIPGYWDSSLAHLTGLLQDSVPTGPNKTAAHGQGSQPITVPAHVVSYMLHMAASAILFMAEAERRL